MGVNLPSPEKKKIFFDMEGKGEAKVYEIVKNKRPGHEKQPNVKNKKQRIEDSDNSDDNDNDSNLDFVEL
jgi:hypothetical protein